jgi:hypothetical protein
MKKIYQIAVMALVMVFFAGAAHAQEWTKDQTEVWKVVQDTWKGWKNNDASAAFGSVHEKYQGWSDDSPIPMGLSSVKDWFNDMKDGMSMNYYSIEPARIVVLKDAAVVHYFYYMNISWRMGDQSGNEEMKGKVAEFYVKDGGKWLLVGDMMTHDEDDD